MKSLMPIESFIQQIFNNLPCARNCAENTRGNETETVPALKKVMPWSERQT